MQAALPLATMRTSNICRPPCFGQTKVRERCCGHTVLDGHQNVGRLRGVNVVSVITWRCIHAQHQTNAHANTTPGSCQNIVMPQSHV
jgi:hypothetical protein